MPKLGVVTTIPGRERMLGVMLESIAPHLDEVRVLACGGADVKAIGELPSNVTVETRADRASVEARFTLVRDWQGLVYTLDDDVAYADAYVAHLAHYAEGRPYPVSLHGQRFERGPVLHYRMMLFPGYAHYRKPTLGGWANQLGFGWACWDNTLFKIPALEPLGNDDAQIAVACQKSQTPMFVVPHDGSLSHCQDAAPAGSIYQADHASGFSKRLGILKKHKRWVTFSGDRTVKPLARPSLSVENVLLARKPTLTVPEGGGVLALCIAARAGKNAERFIGECVAAIREQRMPDGWTLDLRFGVDACPATSAALTTLGVPHWRSDAQVGAYVMRNSLVALRPAHAYAIFDCDDVMKPRYLEWACHAYPNKIIGASREEHGHRRPWVHGVATFGCDAWKKLGGYRAWVCLADSDIIRRAQALGITRHRSEPALYFRRMHAASLIHSKETGLGSPLRRQMQQNIERGINKRDLVVVPVTTPLEYVP